MDLTTRLRPASAGALTAADGFDDRATRLRRAIAAAVAYGDLFDWPLTPDEVHRSLPIPARLEEVTAALAPARLGPTLATIDGFVVARGREDLVERRVRCAEVSDELWPPAERAARFVGRLPWVKMVAVSGSLAVGAATDDADVDLFIVADDGRVWLARAVTIGVAKAVGRLPARHRAHLCPNYLVADVERFDLPRARRVHGPRARQLVPVSGPTCTAHCSNTTRGISGSCPTPTSTRRRRLDAAPDGAARCWAHLPPAFSLIGSSAGRCVARCARLSGGAATAPRRASTPRLVQGPLRRSSASACSTRYAIRRRELERTVP